MLLTTELEIKWNKNNKNYYINKGYKFTKYGDTFVCKIEDALRGTKNIVECSCDYCGKLFTKMFFHYDDNKEYVNKDACKDCKRLKQNEITKIKNKIIYTDKIKNICKQLNYELQDFDYEGENTKIPYICNKHREYGVQHSPYTSLSQGHGCYYCGRERTISSWKFTYNEVKEIIEKDGKNKLLSTNYTRCKDWNLSITCEECGKPFLVSLDYYQRTHKTKCNNCSCSYGERMIHKYLNEHFIDFETEKEIIIKGRSYPLRLDCFISSYNMAIEFDGEQHYFPVNFDGYSIERFKKEFEELQIRDKEKNNYCKNNNIILMRIPYWERDNISNVLDDYFNNNDLKYIIN